MRMRSTQRPALGGYPQIPVDARGFRTLRASGVQNPATMLAKIEERAVASAPTTDGDACVRPNAGSRADCGPGDAVAAHRSTALAQPTPPPHGSRRGRGLLARCSYRGENWWHGCPLRRLTQTSGSCSHAGTAASGKWEIDPLPRCPPSKQVRTPALGFHKSSTPKSPDGVPVHACCSSQR
jgi:hypothetical protein